MNNVAANLKVEIEIRKVAAKNVAAKKVEMENCLNRDCSLKIFLFYPWVYR